MKLVPRFIAYSLGGHGLALAMLLFAGANALAPGRTPEAASVIRASLIYALSSHGVDQSDAVVPPRTRESQGQAGAIRRAAGQPVPAAIVGASPDAVRGTGPRRETGGGAEKSEALSLNLPPSGSDGVGKATGREPLSDIGYQNGTGQAEPPKMERPRYLSAARPVYPWMARLRGYEGMVLLAVEVLKDGRAGRISIKKTSGYALLDQSAMKAVREWRFDPARKAGAPLVATVDIPIRFALNASD